MKTPKKLLAELFARRDRRLEVCSKCDQRAPFPKTKLYRCLQCSCPLETNTLLGSCKLGKW